jgi:hypothetical protein
MEIANSLEAHQAIWQRPATEAALLLPVNKLAVNLPPERLAVGLYYLIAKISASPLPAFIVSPTRLLMSALASGET